MRLSHHGGKRGKDFRAAHAMSMRRKLSSYHRNGIPSAMRGRTGRRGSKFESSTFMKSRRMSQRVGLDSALRGMLGDQSDDHHNEVARDLLGTEESSSSDEEALTNETQTDHYHSYHLYSVYEDLHKPRVSGRPGSARTVYLRTCEEEVRSCEERSDELRSDVCGISTPSVDTYLRTVAAANSINFFNVINASSFATRFARRSSLLLFPSSTTFSRTPTDSSI